MGCVIAAALKDELVSATLHIVFAEDVLIGQQTRLDTIAAIKKGTNLRLAEAGRALIDHKLTCALCHRDE